MHTAREIAYPGFPEGGTKRLDTLIELKLFNSSFVRACPLIEIRQTVPCRAIRGNSILFNSTLPPFVILSCVDPWYVDWPYAWRRLRLLRKRSLSVRRGMLIHRPPDGVGTNGVFTERPQIHCTCVSGFLCIYIYIYIYVYT